MIITSKFPGECRVCGGRFNAGTKIEWARGIKPAHVSCAVERIIKAYDEPTSPSVDDFEEDYARALAFSEGF